MVSIGIRLNLRVLKVWFLALLIKIDTFIFKSLIFVLKIDSFSLKLEKETLLLFDGNCFTENPFWFWSLVWILVMQILQIVFCLDYTLCNSVLCGLFFWAFLFWISGLCVGVWFIYMGTVVGTVEDCREMFDVSAQTRITPFSSTNQIGNPVAYKLVRVWFTKCVLFVRSFCKRVPS